MPTQEQEELMEAYMAAQKARGVTEANMEKVVLLEPVKDLITDPLLGTADVWANLPPSEHAQFEELTALTVGFVPGMEYQNTDKIMSAIRSNEMQAGVVSLRGAVCSGSSVMMPGEYFDPNERMLGRLFETTARIGVLPGAGLKCMMGLSRLPRDLPDAEYKLFKKLLPYTILVDLRTGKLIAWHNIGSATVRIPRADGSYLVVCWWVIKAMLLPERPSEAILQTLPVEPPKGPWRQRLVIAKPMHHTPGQPASTGGATYSMDGWMEGPCNMGRRQTIAYLAYMEADDETPAEE